MKTKILVIGNGMVGHHFVEQMARDENTEITVIGSETRAAYDRVHLSSFFDGTDAADLQLSTRDKYKAMGVNCVLGEAVTKIDPASKKVSTEKGRSFSYDKLILATGSYPFVPPISGGDARNCLVYRTIDDLGLLEVTAREAGVGVVVGGGLLGLEAANALKNLGLEVHVIEFGAGLMGVQLDPPGSRMLRREIEGLGVTVHTNTNTQKITENKDKSLVMHFADGNTLETGLIVFSAGIRPYDDLAESAGLTKGKRGGFVIDQHCRTNDPDIYAIGECASFGDQTFGLVAPGYRMAEVVVNHLNGEDGAFEGADMSTKLKLMGVDVGALGDGQGLEAGTVAYTYSNERDNVYKRLNVDAKGKRVVGAILVGDTSDYDLLHQYFLNEIAIPADPESMILPSSEGGLELSAGSLPATATICSCHNVTKGGIVSAIDGGACSLADVKAATAASSGCGGCAALLKSVVDDELTARGVEVSDAICEHFDYSRQALFDIIRVSQIKDFKTLLKTCGKGHGCEICKPTAGSMFASLWNGHILDKERAGLQDTNDFFLGNIQKNGTYSVVPRVPGGEITPAGLIAIGEVATKFDLYTKITGGQRIDLFGAHVHDLPEIWRQLIEAGFETGHAYGKSLRTVKSCVGDSWCRYGVQDSVGMAILLENRYKGVRAPHKIKLAVSGCTRECAEAQSKDFGVIATENGWNLFVCGNGGMRPRHGDLFATDLDDASLVSTIDRIMMFYIRTADRLQRTSVWMENMEGGLDYLKSVVVDDALGICAELETQMDHLIATYECEWKATIENPERLKRFRTFVNSDAADPSIRFERERGQIVPTREPIMLAEVK